MKYKLTILILLVMICSVNFACTRSGETTPEMAQNMLKLRGYHFTEKEFFKAFRLSDAQAVRGFLQAGINPNAKNEDGETALTFAIQNSDTLPIKVLIEEADINMRDNLGNSPLHLALKKEKDDVFKLLLDKNPDVNVPGRINAQVDGQTVLYIAVYRNDEELVKQLLDRGANPNLADSKGSLPLVEAVFSAKANIGIIKKLLDKGAEVNKKETQSGATALIFAAQNTDIPTETRQEIIKLLLEKGADKSIKTDKGKTALDWAKELKNEDVVELLK